MTSKKIDELERLWLIVEPVLGEWKFFRDGAYGIARRRFNEQTKRPGLAFDADRRVAEACVELLNAAPELIASAKEAERLREALNNCPGCDGSGNAYLMEDETEIGQAPGSSRIDCPYCTDWRAALTGEKA